MNKYDVCIIGGCGHVGLPLAIVFANKGLKVCIYDIDKKAMEIVNRGKMPFLEEGAEEMLEKVRGRSLFTTDDPEVISKSKFIVIVIGTPVDEHLNPKYYLMKNFRVLELLL